MSRPRDQWHKSTEFQHLWKSTIDMIALYIMFNYTYEALLMISEKSSMLPSVSGYWKIIPPMSFLEKSTVLTSTISILIPNGLALVATQLIV